MDKVKQKYPSNDFIKLDIGQDLLPEDLSAKKFDIRSAFDVLFHMTDDVRYQNAISNISYPLRKDGIFMLTKNFLHNYTVRCQHQVNHTPSFQ